jgi:alginate O-acetyltransferase complex protein AlgI
VLVLTAASFVFYAWEQPWLLTLLIASIAINVVTSYRVAKSGPARQRFWAIAGVTLNLALLLFFKYGPLAANSFFGGSATSVGHFLVTIPLPIGISFFTFQGISLVVEVFRSSTRRDASPDDRRAARVVPASFGEHLKHTMLFKAFFPSLVAGPIVKAHEFYPQIREKHLRDIRVQAAFRALVIGYFLKMVIADNLSGVTFWIEYPYFLNESTVTLAGLLFAYSIQIFADFAGYSLIAIGLAHLFGYALPKNFDFPYLSCSFAEFWRRWHISLSTWLREYLYVPLGGNRRGELRTYLNLFIVMFLGGLWHGAAWSYAIWGSFHGLALATERWFRGRLRWPEHGLVRVLQGLLVFAFVTLAWLLFKLPHFEHVVAYLGAMIGDRGTTNYVMLATILTYSSPVILYYAWHVWRRRFPAAAARGESLVFGALLFAIVLDAGTAGRFIYFQF